VTTNSENQRPADKDPNVLQQPSLPYVIAMPIKSPGIAVLLTFLWLGAGHLYAGSITAGVLLLILDFLLILLSLVPFAIILTIPIWIIAFIICSISVVRCIETYNRRLRESGNLHS
jgi:hypothetical protein